MSIFRESFQKDIKASLENRQKAMTRRSTDDIQYLNARNSWIRMCSSVNVNNDGGKLASQYVLQGGTLQSGSFALKSGIGTSANDAYSTTTPSNTPHRLGIRPMPGITGMEVKSKSAYGSLREATVSFQCWDVKQLEDLELLYMRPGYTVLIEWGWAPYLDKNGSFQFGFTDYYSNNILNATVKDRTKIFQDLYDKCTKYGGNYDAIFGYVKNYQWSAREDGGYDCQTTVISTGEVIESIKVNYVRGDLKSLKMYETGSVGAGFLNGLFDNQGNTKSTQFAEHYQKNVLAGIWAELNYKLKDPNAKPLSTLGSQILDKKYVVLDLPGLTNYGNFDTFIQPGSKNKAYITLEAAFDIINKYVLVKSSNDQEPLVQLTTKTETYSGNSAQDLLCVAHPVQISVDPTACMIKNDLWADTIAPAITTATSGSATAADRQADIIINEIDLASVNKTNPKASPPDSAITNLSDSGGEVDGASFYAAITKISAGGAPLLESINRKLVAGIVGAGRQYNNGLAGWIDAEFKQGSSTSKGAGYSRAHYPEVGPDVTKVGLIDNNITTIWYVYKIAQEIKKIPGYTVAINLTNINTSTTTTLENILASSGNPTLRNRYELYSLTKSSTTPLAKIITDASKAINQTIESLYEFSSITITSSGATAASVALVLNAGDATNILKSLKKLDQQFFLNGDSKTELGIIGNIYVSLDFLYRQSLNVSLESSDTKEKNEINLYSYIKGIMSGIQVSIGNLNNFEVHVDPVDNRARVIDVNYTHDKTVSLNNLFKLEVQNLNSIVRNYTLQSQIFPNQSSIIAIGSQVKAGQGGIQNKTLTGFNKGLTDRIVGDKVDPFGNDSTEETLATGLAGIIVLYASLGVSIDPNTANNLNIGEYISRAKNALRDLIVYFQNLSNVESPGSNRNILPFKFSFEMDGIGGLVIGSLFRIDEEILPKGYQGKTAGVQLAQTVTTIAHSISNGDWTTKIDALNLILNRKGSTFDYSKLPALINEAAQAIIAGGLGLGLGSGGGSGGPGGSFFGASGGKDCGRFPSYNLVANKASTLTQSQIVNQLKTTYSADLKMLAKILIIGTLEQGLMTKSSGTVIVGGNFNYFGIQGDIGQWTDPSKYIIGCHEANEGSTGCRRYFASFGSLENAAKFMEFQINRKKINTATTAEAITDAYINTWWSPGNKATILANKTTSPYTEKLKITKSAIAALTAYGISI